jgi:ribosomal protein S21
MSQKVNVEVKARQGEHSERLVKRFLNKVKKEKIVEEVQNRRYYETPTAKRSRMKNRRKKVMAKLRREREAKDTPREKKEERNK